MKKYFVVFLASVFSVFVLAGCETMEGFGDDTEEAGDEIEDMTD